MALHPIFRNITVFCAALITAALLHLGVAATVRAEGVQTQAIHEYIRALNTPTSLETAASHGRSGFSMGIGAQKVPPNSRMSEAIAENVTRPPFDPTSPRLIPNIWITKGIFWPVDVGLNFGYSEDQKVKKIGGYLQWSIYQEFMHPAIALRLDHSEVTAPEFFKSTTSGVNGLISWGYGPISLLASVGIISSRSVIADESGASFGLTRIDDSDRQQLSGAKNRYSYGIQFQIPASLIMLTAENIVVESRSEVLAAKISVAM